MPDPHPFLTFQKFQDPALAEETAGILKAAGIESEIETNSHYFNPSFINDPINQGMTGLKLRPQDFVRADQVLGEYYKTQLDAADKDYYLFSFTDEELAEILAKPDEWGPFDYQLAQKILKERGQEISPENAEKLKRQRITDLKRGESTPTVWILLGYLSAFLGGVLGIVIGVLLIYSKKTLPNAERVYTYRESERRQGRFILLLSIISIPVWWLLGTPQPALFGFLGPL